MTKPHAPAEATFSGSDYLTAMAVVVIWGANFVVMKAGMAGMGPMLLGALRFAAASLPFVFFVKRPAVPWRFVVLYGLAQGLGQFGLLFTAIQMGMTAGMASVVMQAQAFFTLVLATQLLGERVYRHQWAGLLLAALGLAVLASAHGEQPGQMTLVGFVLTLGAALMWAVSNLVVRFMGRASAHYEPFNFIVWSSLVPIVPFLGLAVAADGASGTWHALAGLEIRQLLAVAFLALFATSLAYTLWTGLLKRYPAGKVAPFSLFVPVVGLLAAYLAFGEALNPLQVAGTMGVLAGLLVNQFGARLPGFARHC